MSTSTINAHRKTLKPDKFSLRELIIYLKQIILRAKVIFPQDIHLIIWSLLTILKYSCSSESPFLISNNPLLGSRIIICKLKTL